MNINLEIPHCVVRQHFGKDIPLQSHVPIILFFKRGEEKALICRAAVKPAGRSPESKR
ncbi:MAG: hypothetical protein IJT08_04050 [Alphaproteobacteria bacterium]|nr:hypothetical protein [Alphaproteobacteria bacterium]